MDERKLILSKGHAIHLNIFLHSTEMPIIAHIFLADFILVNLTAANAISDGTLLGVSQFVYYNFFIN